MVAHRSRTLARRGAATFAHRMERAAWNEWRALAQEAQRRRDVARRGVGSIRGRRERMAWNTWAGQVMT